MSLHRFRIEDFIGISFGSVFMWIVSVQKSARVIRSHTMVNDEHESVSLSTWTNRVE